MENLSSTSFQHTSLIQSRQALLECHPEVANGMGEDHQQEHVIGKIEQSVLADGVENRILIQIAHHLGRRKRAQYLVSTRWLRIVSVIEVDLENSIESDFEGGKKLYQKDKRLKQEVWVGFRLP